MNRQNIETKWHRIIILMVLCLFGLSIAYSVRPRRTQRKVQKVDNKVYLDHADELRYDMYGVHPDVQIAKGGVIFRHKGGMLTCDSAYYNEISNSFEAFGHVKYRQSDTLQLEGAYALYDGNEELAQVRSSYEGSDKRTNVVLTHRKSKLYCDSLDYDRMYGKAYFFGGGKLVDKGSVLVSDWGEYNTENRQSVFYYNVKLTNDKMKIDTDTLYYDTKTSLSHVVGPSVITSDNGIVHTENAYYNSSTERSELYGRSKVENGPKTIIADSLYTNNKTGSNEGFGNVVYEDTQNKNMFLGNHIYYEENTGYGFATDSAVVIDYSQQDTLYMHADSIKMFTYNIDTDSVYRKLYAYNHVRAYRRDVQAVCDTLIYCSLDSCLTLLKDPILWNMGRQVLGEVMHAYMADSTVRYADVIGQALTVEKMDSVHYNQLASKEMRVYFEEGKPQQTWAVGNVQSIYYPIDDSDTTIIGLNYLETDTMKIYLTPERKLHKIVTNKANAVMYPITQIPPQKYKLNNFAWFDYIRPVDKDDIFLWRGKGKDAILKEEKRREAPVRKVNK